LTEKPGVVERPPHNLHRERMMRKDAVLNAKIVDARREYDRYVLRVKKFEEIYDASDVDDDDFDAVADELQTAEKNKEHWWEVLTSLILGELLGDATDVK
jgi:hypothetical protein